MPQTVGHSHAVITPVHPAILLAAAFSSQLGWRAGTPEPLIDGQPSWVAMYWKTWEILQAKTVEQKAPSSLPPRFLSLTNGIGFDATAAIALYAKWAWRAVPIEDTFAYSLQLIAPKGSAPEFVDSEAAPSPKEAQGPPLQALAADELFAFTGSKAFLSASLPPLIRRHAYVEDKYTVREAEPPETTSKKPPVALRRLVPPGWSLTGLAPPTVTESAEAVSLLLLDSVELNEITGLLQQTAAERMYSKEVQRGVVDLMKLWDDESGVFAGESNGSSPEEQTLLPLMGLIGGSVPRNIADDALKMLADKRCFATPLPLPLFSKTSTHYQPAAGARPLAAYMALRALMDNGQEEAAGRLAESLLRAYAASAGTNLTLYSSYGPETMRPAPLALADAPEAGLITVAALYEAVLGFKVDAARQTVEWRIRRTDRHGVKRLRFANNVVDLVCEPRSTTNQSPVISVRAESPFTLRVVHRGAAVSRKFPAGSFTWKL